MGKNPYFHSKEVDLLYFIIITCLKNSKIKNKIKYILGILISNKSVKSLLDELKHEKCSFILTRKVNQDGLINLYSFLNF